MALRYLVTMVALALLSEILPAASFIRYLNNPCLSSPDSCTGNLDGNYPICHPGCQSGDYIACSNGFGYIMPCPVGWYSGNGGSFLKKMMYDPSSDSCELSTPHCLRLGESSPATPITTILTTTTPAAETSETTTPQITTPTTTPTTNNLTTSMTPPETITPTTTTLTTSTSPSETTTPTTESSITTPPTITSMNPSTTIPTTTTPRTPEACMAAMAPTCKGLPNGSYPACPPDCRNGLYFLCENELHKQKTCERLFHPIFGYVQGVFDPPVGRCRFYSGSCPTP
ncbi:unnamed protein product [Candidula unifasciata]|uniref:Uncharacterized protein n=1 Tax=Candidula unifasciata TaxID=100452 RepID=A0A8S3Z9F3_9EUPU|nr:unnamed protein product [Candidula unifasciata]